MTAWEQCSGAERQICTLSARGFELATFRLLVHHSNHSSPKWQPVPFIVSLMTRAHRTHIQEAVGLDVLAGGILLWNVGSDSL